MNTRMVLNSSEYQNEKGGTRGLPKRPESGISIQEDSGLGAEDKSWGGELINMKGNGKSVQGKWLVSIRRGVGIRCLCRQSVNYFSSHTGESSAIYENLPLKPAEAYAGLQTPPTPLLPAEAYAGLQKPPTQTSGEYTTLK